MPSRQPDGLAIPCDVSLREDRQAVQHIVPQVAVVGFRLLQELFEAGGVGGTTRGQRRQGVAMHDEADSAPPIPDSATDYVHCTSPTLSEEGLPSPEAGLPAAAGVGEHFASQPLNHGAGEE